MKPLTSVLAILLLSITTLASTAEIYRWVDSEGRVHYSDREPTDTQAEVRWVNDEATPAVADAPKPAAAISRIVEPQPPEAPPPISAFMYSSPKCGWCRKAERYFDARSVPWRSVDITASKQAKREFDDLGGRGTPLIFIEGEKVAGFNEAKLDQILQQYGR